MRWSAPRTPLAPGTSGEPTQRTHRAVGDRAAGGKHWLPVAAGREATIGAGEELFPMFPVNFREGPQPRRLFVGLVPVASAETFRASPAVEPFPPRPGGTGPAGIPDADP